MDEIVLVIPYWFYPYNLGDAVSWTSGPECLKRKYPDSKLIVVTCGELLKVLSKNPFVDQVSVPSQNLLGDYNFWKDHALNSSKFLPKNMFVLFAEHHPEVWNFWNKHYDFLVEHPTLNLLYVNHLLQLGLEEQAFTHTDFYPKIYLEEKPEKEKNTLGIVPAVKMTGDPRSPGAHPGCDGKGFRFNGDNGESWQKFVDHIRFLKPDIHILEFSKSFYGWGDEHIGHLPWEDLAAVVNRPTVSITSDGGMHHVFNSQDSRIVLLAAQRINKLDHYKSRNTTCYYDLHSDCVSRCGDFMRTLTTWKDMEKICDWSCQKVDPIKLAEKVYHDFF